MIFIKMGKLSSWLLVTWYITSRGTFCGANFVTVEDEKDDTSFYTKIPTLTKNIGNIPRVVNSLNLSMSTEHISACFSKSQKLSVESEIGYFTFLYDPENVTKGREANKSALPLTSICSIEVVSPFGKVLFLSVKEMKINSNSSCFTVFDSPDWPPLIHKCGRTYLTFMYRESFTNVVIFKLKIDLSSSFFILLEFRGRAKKYNLKLNYTSRMHGYIQTPDLDTSYLDGCVRVPVPTGFAVMIGIDTEYMSSINTFSDLKPISLYNGSALVDDMKWKPLLDYHSFVLHTNIFFMRYNDHYFIKRSKIGFIFSFHNTSQLLEQQPDGLWNCSVPHWSDFKQHFPCDYNVRCVNEEDKLSCPYYSEGCGSGFLTPEGNCFLLLKPRDRVSWSNASKQCVQYGGRLAMPKTVDKMSDVFRFLRSAAVTNKYNYVSIGLRSSTILRHMYKSTGQWLDGTVDLTFSWNPSFKPVCGFLNLHFDYKSHFSNCFSLNGAYILCDTKKEPETKKIGKMKVSLENKSQSHRMFSGDAESNHSFVRCPTGHVTHAFLAFDEKSSCCETGLTYCSVSLTSQLPYFNCFNGIQRIPYTLVCDHRPDCTDESDESLCVFPGCPKTTHYDCGNLQCVQNEHKCDVIEHCVNGADEIDCFLKEHEKGDFNHQPFSLDRLSFVVIDFDGRNRPSFTLYNFTWNITEGENTKKPELVTCPETHFMCPTSRYCLPVYLLCNGVFDCPSHEDEVECDSYTCLGYFRCRASRVCVHSSHVCDGVFQCPQRDDELLCDLTCPENCTCFGLAFACVQSFPVQSFPDLRFVDAHGTGMTLRAFKSNAFLVHLNLSNCGLADLDNVVFNNLQSLDLSNNRLYTFSFFNMKNFKNVRFLYLAGNPLNSIFQHEGSVTSFYPNVRSIDLSRVHFQELNLSIFSLLPNLQALTLTDSGVTRLVGDGFQGLKELRTLDVRGCLVAEIPRGVFKDLDKLETVFGDNFKLCCPSSLPADFKLSNCHAPFDEISSCDAMLRSDLYRVCLSIFSVLSVLGNSGSFVYRAFFNRRTSQSGYGTFVTHLCVSDFLMGVYLAMIGVADRIYQSTYVWEDSTWRYSVTCKIAGFLSLLSHEVSTFFVCLITLERLIVLAFPFSPVHFRKLFTFYGCMVAWCVGLVLAALPLLPMTSHWEFFSQNAICIPLPITRKMFLGHYYSFGIMIVFNSVLFVLVAIGQISIFLAVQRHSISNIYTTKRSQEFIIARRLIYVALLGFLCWFPIGSMGILAANGSPIPSEVNVAVSIIVLPLNSALNPFLYTLNMIRERRQRAVEEKLVQNIIAQMKSKSAVFIRFRDS